ncbi:MAG: BON domain-containing protein, partial [Acidobacteria bacterium]|nr:BON domain-containing protein [Acidobacteriota bacterium]
MRRFFLGMAIASLTAGASLTAFGGDREIADAIIATVKKSQIDLKGFDVDLTVENGNVTVSGAACSQKQLDEVLHAARATEGVKSVDCKVSVAAEVPSATESKAAVVSASANEVPALLTDVTDGASAPVKPMPRTVASGDAAITSEILNKLGSAKKAGSLKGGYVSTPEQKAMVLKTAQYVSGVQRVVDEVAVNRVQAASGQIPGVPGIPGIPGVPSVPGVTAPVPGLGAPAMSGAAPRPFAPSTVNGSSVGGPYTGNVAAPQAPMPMQGGPSYGGGTPRYDQPYMPSYAWPSYAAYPNYAAVTYPKQYSASAWPYIGPFYP